jgi:hypothetical protein
MQATPDRDGAGHVAGGGGRVETPASRDRRRVGRLVKARKALHKSFHQDTMIEEIPFTPSNIT